MLATDSRPHRSGGRVRYRVLISVGFASACGPLLLACSTGPPKADSRIEAIFPAPPPNSLLYWEKFQDGKWRGDQPPPEIQRRWLVDCSELDNDAGDIEEQLADHDFVKVDTMTNGLNYLRESDGFTADVWTSRDPDEFWSTNNQFGLERDLVETRCLVAATIQDTEYFDR